MWLSVLIWLPIVAAAVLGLAPGGWVSVFRWAAVSVSLVQAALAAWLLGGFAADGAGCRVGTGLCYGMEARLPWLWIDLGGQALQIEYHVAADAAAVLLLLLTAVVCGVASVSAWGIGKDVKAFYALLLLLNGCMMGVFVAADFFLFYLFYEFMLLPMFFLIGLWGSGRAGYAALKFFIYTLFGSVFMLLIMAGLALSFVDPVATALHGKPVHTLDMGLLAPDGAGLLPHVVPGGVLGLGQVVLGLDARMLAFGVLFVAFGIKLPIVPLHTWLPDAHVESATPVSVLLAGVMLKVGGYGLYRLCFQLFAPEAAQAAWWVGLVGAVGVVYGALVAMGQQDLKRMVAYSSVSHMGYVLLGLASLMPVGMQGAVFQLCTHGLISPMLFLLVGVLYDRVHDRQISSFTGLWGLMPRYTLLVAVGFFASLGLPGLCAFVSEVMVLMGAVQAAVGPGARLPLWMAGAGVAGVFLSAVYYLRTFRQMFFGTFAAAGSDHWATRLTDLTRREYAMLLPLATLIVLLGVLPMLVLRFL